MMLRDVSKCSSGHHLRDCLSVNTELARKPKSQFAIGGALSDFAHLVRRQFGSAVSILGGHVTQVVCVCAKEQVSRITARLVVAGVADHQPLIDRAVCHLVSHAMGAKLPPATFDCAIPAAAEACRPRPTRIWATALINTIPEAKRERDVWRWHPSILPVQRYA